jgi:FkbM family methyltransferase
MLFKTLKYIWNHPYNRHNRLGAILRFFKWQVGSRLNPYPVAYPYTEKTRLLVWNGLTGATGNIYCGLLEYDDMCFLLHFLREEDLFIDAGANVGAYTILASGEVGSRTLSIEPVPRTFSYLSDNIHLNRLDERVSLFNIGLGSQAGKLKFTSSLDTVNHVATRDEPGVIDVEVRKMDELSDNIPALIKIDVEGFETEVLRGAQKILANPILKAIIIELNGSGARYGYDENQIHADLLQLGFTAFGYDPAKRALLPRETFGNHNTIYVRDMPYVSKRLNESQSFKIGSNHRI